jgi:hypothetical protein
MHESIVPRCTPWGALETREVIAPGIVGCSTSSHGGFWLSAERKAEMPPSLRSIGTWAGGNWYEEDSDWAIVVLSFPQFFKAKEIEAAHSTVRNAHPEEYGKFRGSPVLPEESHTSRKRLFDSKHANDYQVVAAWGDWKLGVPQGFVGCGAIRGGRDGKTPEDVKWFLVPAAEYQARGEFSFVIDLHRHQEVPKFL